MKIGYKGTLGRTIMNEALMKETQSMGNKTRWSVSVSRENARDNMMENFPKRQPG